MNIKEHLELKCILMINALVRFNLIPPPETKEALAHLYNYKSLSLHVLPVTSLNPVNEVQIMSLLAEAVITDSPLEKLNLYRKISAVVGLKTEQLTCTTEFKFDSLSALCSFTIFKSLSPVDKLPSGLNPSVVEWCQFQNKMPEYFLFDADKYKAPWTSNKIAAKLCLELVRATKVEVINSCLYALAVVLDHPEIVARLTELNISHDNLPRKIKKHCEQFAPFTENNSVSHAKKPTRCEIM